jgi:hypothetical protein
MKPPIPLTDPRFVYTPSYLTDIRKTFAKARASVVRPLKKEKRA